MANATDGSSVDTSKWRISIQEYLKGREKLFPLRDYEKRNMMHLLTQVNMIRDLYGKSMVVSSGYRPPSINAATPGASSTSLHMSCEAIDIADPTGEVSAWCLTHLDLLTDLGLYLENPAQTNKPSGRWVHMQSKPPKSGKRIFSV